MGHHCCSKQKVKRGLWSPEEDEKLVKYITTNGHGCWSSVPKLAGLQRCGKSCRLRWINYLRPDLKRGSFSAQEERIIIDVHRILGNRWAQIAKHLPGRTDNEVKNFWNSCIKKKLIAQGLDPKTHNLMPNSRPTNSINPSNLSQLNQAQISTTPFTISSPIKSIDTVKNTIDFNSTMVPQTQTPNISLHETLPILNFQYQDTHVLMSFSDQNLSNTPIIDPHTSIDFTSNNGSSSSSLDHTNLSHSSFQQHGFVDDTCMWVEAFETLDNIPKHSDQLVQQHQHQQVQVQVQVQVQEQLQPTMYKMDHFNESTDKDLDMDTSYNTAAFDIELMESALLPPGVFCNGSSIEQLHWD